MSDKLDLFGIVYVIYEVCDKCSVAGLLRIVVDISRLALISESAVGGSEINVIDGPYARLHKRLRSGRSFRKKEYFYIQAM